MKDFILIENLEIFANHGVLKEEVVLGQKFLISAVLYLDVSAASANDEINKTVNYAQVCKFITKFVKENTFNLIETVADRLAKELLIEYELLEAVDITVKKPWAPVGCSLENVMITVSRGWHKVFLALGSNMGDKEANLNHVLKRLDEECGFKDIKPSEFIKTKPYGGVEQDDFLNAVVKVKTIYSEHELLDFAHLLEQEKNRKREIVWGPRTLDVDILFYDDISICDDDLVIPHPDIANRDFVLGPMTELAPHFIHPVTRKSMRQMCEELEKRSTD